MAVMSTAMTIRLAALAIVAAAAPARAGGVTLTEKGDNTTQGVVIVDAPPEQVYAFATNYAQWPRTLSDIKSVRFESGGRDNARLWFDSRAMDHEVLVQFENIPNQAIRFRGIKGVPGATARGEYRLEPIDGGKRTRITANLYLIVKGPVGWFVSDSKTRGMRQTKVRADLTDVARHFANPVSSRETPPRAP